MATANPKEIPKQPQMMYSVQGRTGSNIRPGKILLNRPTLLKTDLFFIQNSIMLGADTKNLHIFDRSTVFTWYRCGSSSDIVFERFCVGGIRSSPAHLPIGPPGNLPVSP